jgi:hypothetical protein
VVALPSGIGFQCYRDAIKGASTAAKREAYKRACGQFAAAGGTWVAPHGYSLEFTPDKVGPLALIAKAEGLTTWPFYGLDDTDMAGKGRRIGRVALMPEVAGVGFDLEEDGEDDDTPTDAAQVRALRTGFRSVAPSAVAIVQCWELPQKHPTMPYDELAALADLWSPMEYLNNWTSTYGAARAARMEPRWTQGRAWLAQRILPRVLPFMRTTHAVGWADIPADLDATMQAHRARLLIWCEPFPSAQVLAAVKRAVGDAAAARGDKRPAGR